MPEAAPQRSTFATLLDLMRGQRLRYGAGIVALAISTGLLYLPPLVLKASVDTLLGAGEQARPSVVARLLAAAGGREALARSLVVAAGLIVLTTAAGGLFAYLKGRFAAVASERIARRLRERLYDHLQHVPVGFHDSASTGDLVQRCTSDAETLRTFYSTQVTDVARALLLVAIVLPILLTMDLALGLLAVALLPPIVGYAIVFFRKIRRSFLTVDEAEGAITAALQENLTGIRVVRAFARQDFEIERFAGKNAAHRDLHYRLFKVLAWYWSSSDLMCFAQMGLVLFVGAYRASAGLITPGELVAFVTYAQLYVWPVRQTGRVVTEMGKASVAIGRIQEVLAVPREAEPAGPAGLPARAAGHIRLSRVSFSHGGKEVLHDVTLDIPAGATVALLGPSGAGKSTLVHLLLRLYDYATGSIALDGRELSSLPRAYVRSQFGVVLQEPFLYSKTVGQNIRLARRDATDADVEAAARASAVHDAIASFDQRYDTLVGERGVTLSGGQRQRVALARALLRDAPVLVLDDALSAVDAHTEAEILASLRQRRGRHTTILIAHRLSTLMHADAIVVLDRGRIVQQGPHARLVREDGLYQRLWQIQGALEEDLRRELAPDERPRPALATGD